MPVTAASPRGCAAVDHLPVFAERPLAEVVRRVAGLRAAVVFGVDLAVTPLAASFGSVRLAALRAVLRVLLATSSPASSIAAAASVPRAATALDAPEVTSVTASAAWPATSCAPRAARSHRASGSPG